MASPRVPLGELLVDAQIITREQLEEVLIVQKKDGRRLGTMLVDAGLVTETQVTQILSQQLSVPWVSLYHIDFSRQLLNLVPRELAESHCLVPIFVRRVRGMGETLYVAMDDPSDENAQAAVSEYAGLPVRPMIAPPSDIKNAIRVYYGADVADELASATDDEPDTKVEIKRPSQQPKREAQAKEEAAEAQAAESEAAEGEAAESGAAESEAAESEAAEGEAAESEAAESEAAEGEAAESEAAESEAAESDAMESEAARSEVVVSAASEEPEADEEPPELTSGVMPKAEPLDAPSVEVGEADADVLAELERAADEEEGEIDPVLRAELERAAAEHHEARGEEHADDSLASRAPPKPSKPPGEDRLTPAPESGEIAAHEPAMPAPKQGRAARMITLTLLDGTQVSLPARGKAKPEPEKAPDARPGQQMTARDLVTALRAASQGADASEILGDMSWQRLFAALLSVMMSKHMIADWEFIDELQSDGTPPHDRSK